MSATVSLIKPVAAVSFVKPRFVCTCCLDPRKVQAPRWSRYGAFVENRRNRDKIEWGQVNPVRAGFVIEGSEWFHVDDASAATLGHVHHTGAATDCDGPRSHSHVERPNDFGGISLDDFWAQQVIGLIYAGAIDGKLEIEVDPYDAEDRSATWTERHEEGMREVNLRWCTRPACSYDRATQRDYYAEAAGY